jgi:hypothetical protein
MTYLNPTHRTQKNAIRTHDIDECPSTVQEFPWTHSDGDNESDICAATDVDIFRKEAREIHASRERIINGVDGELTDYESNACEEGCCSRTGRV